MSDIFNMRDPHQILYLIFIEQAGDDKIRKSSQTGDIILMYQ